MVLMQKKEEGGQAATDKVGVIKIKIKLKIDIDTVNSNYTVYGEKK